MNKPGNYILKNRKVKLIMFLFLSISFTTSLYSMPHPKLNAIILGDSVLVDRDGNRYHIKKLLDNNIWMTANLKLKISASYCYENLESNGEKYGRLYTWESAQEGCRLLGEEWQLPTNTQWQQLGKIYGEFPNDSVQNRKKAYTALLTDGSAGFNAILGGARRISGEYARIDAHGFYWTATGTDNSNACFANFAKGSQSLYIQNDGEKQMAISVRCVRKQYGLKK